MAAKGTSQKDATPISSPLNSSIGGLEAATKRCKEKVQQIAKDCRRNNVRFRDLEWDVDEDKRRCLWGLKPSETDGMEPADVRRVKDIFENPVFYAEGPGAGQVVQGDTLKNCWLLAGFSAIATRAELLHRICVARDEKVGVYGFVFYQDKGWVDVVIDDQLFSKVPKYVELTDDERRLYKHNEELYDSIARKGSRTLYFSSSCHENETWIPLLEKAFAKLHGDYKALRLGSSAEAVEDLTGGVSIRQHLSDILDEDAFWNEQITATDKNQLFTCYMHGVKKDEGAKTLLNGLIPNHAYSIIRAVEVDGKRFLKLRNPWADTEWTGRWADGSKEWTSEWLQALPALQHTFGDDGEFLMQYEDFLRTFTMVGRVRLFDDTWTMSSRWLWAHDKTFPRAWDYGEISFTFSMQDASPAVIVLARNDTRAFADLDGPYAWTYDFKLFKRGDQSPVASSRHDMLWEKSVPLEVDLDPGDYVVHVRLDRYLAKDTTFWADNVANWNQRTLARKWTLMTASQTMAYNHRTTDEKMLVLPEGTFAGNDLLELELASYPKLLETKTETGAGASSPSEAINAEVQHTTNAQDQPVSSDEGSDISTSNAAPLQSASDTSTTQTAALADRAPPPTPPAPSTDETPPAQPLPEHEGIWCDICKVPAIKGTRYRCLEPSCDYGFDMCQACVDGKLHDPTHPVLPIKTPAEAEKLQVSPFKWSNENNILLGLRVYTKRHAPTVVKGQVRHGRLIRWSKPEL